MDAYTKSMIHDTDLYNERITNREGTEDGDLAITVTVRAKGFEGIRAYNGERGHFRTRGGSSFGTLADWVGAGEGWLKATYTYVVDGAEIAIERNNDAWASLQQEIEDHACGRGW